MTDDELRFRLAAIERWVKDWVRHQRNDHDEMRKLLHPAVASGAEMAVSNYAVASDDGDAYYERFVGSQVEAVNAAMLDLEAGPAWAYWAICRRHGLGGAGLSYNGMSCVPVGMYTDALLELEPLLLARSLSLG